MSDVNVAIQKPITKFCVCVCNIIFAREVTRRWSAPFMSKLIDQKTTGWVLVTGKGLE